jgi:hypothetical protein
MRPSRLSHPSTARPRPPRPARALLAALLALAAAASGCRHRAQAPGAEEPVPLPEYVFVTVENHNWSDVVISLGHGGAQPYRLGTVTAGQNAMLRFPGQYIAGSTPLQLIAKPVGGFSTLRSQRFVVQPGQAVTWTLENSLERSSLAVY